MLDEAAQEDATAGRRRRAAQSAVLCVLRSRMPTCCFRNFAEETVRWQIDARNGKGARRTSGSEQPTDATGTTAPDAMHLAVPERPCR